MLYSVKDGFVFFINIMHVYVGFNVTGVSYTLAFFINDGFVFNFIFVSKPSFSNLFVFKSSCVHIHCLSNAIVKNKIHKIKTEYNIEFNTCYI